MCEREVQIGRFRIPQGGELWLIVACWYLGRALVFIALMVLADTPGAAADLPRHDSWNSHGRDQGVQCPAQTVTVSQRGYRSPPARQKRRGMGATVFPSCQYRKPTM